MRPTAAMLRRVRIRGLKEGLVQRARADAYDTDARDGAERFQDYGFAAQPVDGQGLKLEVGGHTIILRMDRLAERPQLGAYEVAVWHKEGHKIVLKAGGLVEVTCDLFKVNGNFQCTGNGTFAGNLTAPYVIGTINVTFGGISGIGHHHGNVQNGVGITSGPS